MIVYANKKVVGSIGGGALEKEVIDKVPEILAGREPELFSYELGDDLQMHCGGKADIYIEPILPSNQLLIFGAGHVGKSVAKYASGLGFQITMVDERKEIFEEIHDLSITIINDNYEKTLKNIVFNERLYIVVLTPQHIFDEMITGYCAQHSFAYLGMIGSKRKVKLAREKFLKDGILNEEQIDRIDMPIGIKFEVQTPEEIAISIIAKLIDVKNKLSKIG